jgi:hypothetical protein
VSRVAKYIFAPERFLRLFSGMLFRCGWQYFIAVLVLVSLQTCPIISLFGNGYSCGFSVIYSLSMLVVCSLSLYVPDACPLHPFMLIFPCSRSMFFCGVVSSSCPSAPVSSSMVNIVVYRVVAEFIILFTFSVVGIIGVFSGNLYFGFSHFIWLILQKQSYENTHSAFVRFDRFSPVFDFWFLRFAIYSFTLSGFRMSVFLAIRFSFWFILFIVCSPKPLFLSLIRVFMIVASMFLLSKALDVGCRHWM